MKNLYIIQEVLYDYTAGMVCIAADDLDECEQLFIEKFVHNNYKNRILEFDKAILGKSYKVMQIVHDKSEVVSYVYGGS